MVFPPEDAQCISLLDKNCWFQGIWNPKEHVKPKDLGLTLWASRLNSLGP